MKMSHTGLLTIVNLTNIGNTLAACRKYALKTLYVQIHPQFRTKYNYKCTVYSGFISKLYRSSLQIFDNNIDVRVLISSLKTKENIRLRKNIDYLFFDYSLKNTESQEIIGCFFGSNVIELDSNEFVVDHKEVEDFCGDPIFDNVVLGGAFDRLHVGHKILLTEAALRTRKRLVVGVTNVNMVKNKKLTELILPVNDRIQGVKDFLTDIDTSISYTIVPIHDMYGPTATDPNLDLIVVSTETLKGANSVNQLRKEKKLKKLNIASIDLVNLDYENKDKETKISSSNQRMDLLGVRLKPIQPRPHLSPRPYLIGFTGGVASGKSRMCERFRELGAGIVDCDKIAHSLYEPGADCYQTIIDKFGIGILAPNGTIDRKALGKIVFANKKRLDELNLLIWEPLLKRVKCVIHEMYEQEKKDVIFVEAAVLIQAGWMNEFHEIWSCIITPEIAINRLVERNKMSETEAKKRVEAQMDNKGIVHHSNVVFCTRWSYEFSQEQAEKAWASLMADLKKGI